MPKFAYFGRLLCCESETGFEIKAREFSQFTAAFLKKMKWGVTERERETVCDVCCALVVCGVATHLMRIARQWSFASVNVFDSFDGEQDFLLVAQFDDARVLEVLPGQLGGLLHRLVALLGHSGAVLLQPQDSQPLFQRALSSQAKFNTSAYVHTIAHLQWHKILFHRRECKSFTINEADCMLSHNCSTAGWSRRFYFTTKRSRTGFQHEMRSASWWKCAKWFNIYRESAHRYEIRQAVWDVELRDLRLELLPVVRLLDSNCSQVLVSDFAIRPLFLDWYRREITYHRCHSRDHRHVVASVGEQGEVLLKVQIHQPGVHHILVLESTFAGEFSIVWAKQWKFILIKLTFS